ncbi:TIR domain-containing protein [Chloroflexota bacterium]
MSDVFISHVEEDADVALEIAFGLEEAGYTTWCYEIDCTPGPSYLIQTGEAVEVSKVVVVVISAQSLGSRQVTKEVVRAHESGKEFVPVLQGITHVEFQNRQPEWREAVGAAASIRIPQNNVAAILPRIINGLKTLGIPPGQKTDPARLVQIREAVDELHQDSLLEKTGEIPVSTRMPEPESVTAGTPSVKTGESTRGQKRWVKPAVIASTVVVVAILSIMVALFLRQPEPVPTVPATPTPAAVPTVPANPTPATVPTAPAPSAPVATQEPITLFSDDFESGELTNWNAVRGEAKISERGNNHFLDVTNNAICAVGAPSWTNYKVKARFILLGGRALVIFRQRVYKTDREKVNVSYVLAISKGNASLKKVRRLENAPVESTDLVSTPVQIEPGAWHTLTISCHENEIILDIDKVRTLTCKDTEEPMLSGSISIGSTDKSHVLFDNITIETYAKD